MVARVTVDLNRMRVGWMGTLWNSLTPTRGAKKVSAMLYAASLGKTAKITVGADSLSLQTETKPVELPSSRAYARCFGKAGVTELELTDLASPRAAKEIADLLSDEGVDSIMRLRGVSTRLKGLAEAADKKVSPMMKLVVRDHLRMLKLADAKRPGQVLAELSEQDRSALVKLFPVIDDEMLKSSSHSDYRYGYYDERTELAAFLAHDKAIGLEDKASLLSYLTHGERVFEHRNKLIIALLEMGDISEQAAAHLKKAGPINFGLAYARNPKLRADIVALVIYHNLPESAPAEGRHWVDSLFVNKGLPGWRGSDLPTYAEADYKLAAEIINGHALAKREVVLQELGKLDGELSQAVRPFVTFG
jgi:rhodanese-related sulfurtransferase